MRLDVVTIFPGMFDAVRCWGMTRRALESGSLELALWDPREFTDDNYRRVDDRPYGGGPGMVMMIEPRSVSAAPGNLPCLASARIAPIERHSGLWRFHNAMRVRGAGLVIFAPLLRRSGRLRPARHYPARNARAKPVRLSLASCAVHGHIARPVDA